MSEALRGGVDHALDGAFGHAGIVLELHRRDRAAGTAELSSRTVPTKATAAPTPPSPALQRSHLGADRSKSASRMLTRLVADAVIDQPRSPAEKPPRRRRAAAGSLVAQTLVERRGAPATRRDSASACAPPQPISSRASPTCKVLAVERNRFARAEALARGEEMYAP